MNYKNEVYRTETAPVNKIIIKKKKEAKFDARSAALFSSSPKLDEKN